MREREREILNVRKHDKFYTLALILKQQDIKDTG